MYFASRNDPTMSSFSLSLPPLSLSLSLFLPLFLSVAERENEKGRVHASLCRRYITWSARTLFHFLIEADEKKNERKKKKKEKEKN